MPKVNLSVFKLVSRKPIEIQLQYSSLLLMLFGALFFTSCTTLGPDFKKPSASIEQKWIEADNPQIKAETPDYSTWWRVLNTQQLLVTQQDTLASSRGDIIRYLIAVYKSLGGGWESRVGKDMLPAQTLETMGKRTDWGNLLEPVSLPDKLEQPPTGKDVKLFNKPVW